MKGPLVHLNGPPGVGKLTIGRSLASLIGARLLDNHAVYDVAFALTEFRSPEFYATVRGVRTVAYERIAASSSTTSVILTGADFEGSDWGLESWRAVLALAQRCGAPLFAVQLRCAPEEHRRRIVSESRGEKGKLRDPASVGQWAGRRPFAWGAHKSLELDVTALPPDDAAQTVKRWLDSHSVA